jgi:Phosphoesterase family
MPPSDVEVLLACVAAVRRQMWNAFDGIKVVRYSNDWPDNGSKPFNRTGSCVSWPHMNIFCDIAGMTGGTPPWPNDGGQMWNAFDGISAVRYGSEWPNDNKTPKPFTCPVTANCVSWPNTNIFCDIQGTTTGVCPTPNPSGPVALPAVSWVIPTGEESDHYTVSNGKIVDTGPDWVSSVVNAVGKSKYWDSTAIIIVWDDWGGFWDHVPPPQLDYRGLGFRVPLIIVSPYAKKGYVSHTQYEFGSILKFMESTFGLASLNTTDVRANDLTDSFDFTKKPRPFKTIPSQNPGHDRAYFMALPPSKNAPDRE